jgi:hypothetical protein
MKPHLHIVKVRSLRIKVRPPETKVRPPETKVRPPTIKVRPHKLFGQKCSATPKSQSSDN